jgi:hypothetical protein
MSNGLPVIEHLHCARSDTDRVDWLFRAPDEVHLRTHAEIVLALSGTGFDAGITYSGIRCAAARSVRTPEGRLSLEIEVALAIASLDMRTAAAGGGK